MPIFACPHPTWCDPRLCDARPDGVEHHETPLTVRAGDHEIAVARSRYDETHRSENSPGVATVRVQTRDMVSLTPAGDLLAVAADLSTAEARMLAAALRVVAERLDPSLLAAEALAAGGPR